MKHGLLMIIATALLGLPAVAFGQVRETPLLIEWSDHPGNPAWMPSDPVFQRTLYCWTEGRREICKLTVVTIGRSFCPAVLVTDAFRTDTGDLKVTRTPNAVDLEFTDASNTWTIHLKLLNSFVESASGVAVTKPILPRDSVRSSELVAFVKGDDPLLGREFVEVELKCAKISVVAAKKPAK